MQTFTNNTASLRTKLLSISRTNLLYLPVVELNTVNGTNKKFTGTNGGYFGVAVDTTTQDVLGNEGFGAVAAQNLEGIINGANLTDGTVIRCDQGLDTTEISADNLLDADLVETQYIIEMDNRFGTIVSIGAGEGVTNISANVS